jgi:hypothetical protein
VTVSGGDRQASPLANGDGRDAVSGVAAGRSSRWRRLSHNPWLHTGLSLLAGIIGYAIHWAQTFEWRQVDTGLSVAGQWSCAWSLDTFRQRATTRVEDVVTFTQARDGSLGGSGTENAEYGPYAIAGLNTGYAVAFTYGETHGIARRPGVALLQKKERGGRVSELRGDWMQVSRDSLLRGSAVCVPRPTGS